MTRSGPEPFALEGGFVQTRGSANHAQLVEEVAHEADRQGRERAGEDPLRRTGLAGEEDERGEYARGRHRAQDSEQEIERLREQ